MSFKSKAVTFCLSLIAVLGGNVACVTTDSEMLLLGGAVYVASGIPKAAAEGEERSQIMWCNTLKEVDALLHNDAAASLTPEERAVLEAKISTHANVAGFRMHVTQIHQLIDDAVAVLSNKDARTIELDKCG